MQLDVSFDGIDELIGTFKNLPKSMQRKVYNQALRSGAAPIRESAINNIKEVSKPFTKVLSRRSTIRIYRLKKYQGNYRVSVQIARGLVNTNMTDENGQPVRVGMYAAVLEYGSTKLNRAPKSWIRKAIRDNFRPSINALTEEFRLRMNDAIKDARVDKGRFA